MPTWVKIIINKKRIIKLVRRTKKECPNKDLCAVCSEKFKNPVALANYENMHIRNNNIILCDECDKRIFLKKIRGDTYT